MSEADWFAAICAVFVLGAGALMAAFGERVMRVGGVTCIGIAVAGLIFWFGYYRNAEAQQPNVTGNCNNLGFNSGLMNCGTVNLGAPQPRLDDPAFEHLRQQILGFSHDKSYSITSVLGDGTGFQFATDILGFMKAHDFKASGVDQSVFTQPVSGLQMSENPDGSVTLVVGSLPH